MRLKVLSGVDFSWDELILSRIQPSELMRAHYWNLGYSNIVFLEGLAIWYRKFGGAMGSSRFFTFLIGIFGIYFSFLALRKIIGREGAWISTALIAISGYGIFYSAYGASQICILFFVPVTVFLLIKSMEKKRKIFYFFSGLVLLAGLFSNPGVFIVFSSILLGWILHHYWQIDWEFCKKWFPYRYDAALFLLPGFIGLLLFFFTDAYHQFSTSVQNAPIGMGENFLQICKELILPSAGGAIPGRSVFEWSYLGLLIFALCKNKNHPVVRILFFSLVSYFVLICLGGQGLKDRQLGLLLLSYPLVAIGIQGIMALGWSPVVLVCLLLVPVGHRPLFQNPSAFFRATLPFRILPETLVMGLLKNGEVFINLDDFDRKDLRPYYWSENYFAQLNRINERSSVDFLPMANVNWQKIYMERECRYFLTWADPQAQDWFQAIPSKDRRILKSIEGDFPVFLVPLYLSEQRFTCEEGISFSPNLN